MEHSGSSLQQRLAKGQGVEESQVQGRVGKRLLLDKVEENRLLSTTRILKPLGNSSPVPLVCSGIWFQATPSRPRQIGDYSLGIT